LYSDFRGGCFVAVFFLVVAGLNLALGVVLGIYLAQFVDGPSHAPALETSAAAVPPKPEPQPAAAIPAPEPAPVEKTPVAPAPPEPAPPVAAAPEPAIPAVVASIAALPEQEAAEPEPEEATVGASIAEFKAELSRYRDQLSSLDKQMRDGAEKQDATQIKECLSTLRSANNQYLETHEDATGRFQARCQTPEFEPVKQRLGAALDKQAELVKRSNENLAEVDLENNLLMSCQQLLDETSRLVNANHAMRDTLEDVELQLARTGDLPAAAGDPPADAQNNLISRSQLEAAVAECWAKDPDHKNPMSVGLVDLDRFRDLNDAHGPSVGDRVLDAIAQLVGAAARDDQRAVRMTAQQFLLMFPGIPAREATNVLERIRQHVEATRFESSSGSIAVTVSCAVAESNAGDTLPKLLERVDATLVESKRYGRNRTFLHDGKFPAPVVPPVLPVESRTLAV
jgi:diguanylate cyclase